MLSMPSLACRIFSGQLEASTEAWQSGRRDCYQLAAKLFSQATLPLPAIIDGQTLLGHLFHVCQQAADLHAAPSKLEGDLDSLSILSVYRQR